jgi:hypothetical protein
MRTFLCYPRLTKTTYTVRLTVLLLAVSLIKRVYVRQDELTAAASGFILRTVGNVCTVVADKPISSYVNEDAARLNPMIRTALLPKIDQDYCKTTRDG